MSAFGGKADMTVCRNSLSRSLLEAKRTSRVQCRMCATDFYSIYSIDDLNDVCGLTLAVSRTSDANITDRRLACRPSVAERPIALPPVSVGECGHAAAT